jgi:hypothetical protein
VIGGRMTELTDSESREYEGEYAERYRGGQTE